MGKVLAEGRGDVQESIDFIEYMAGEGRRLAGETVPSELRQKFCMTVRQPKGVVACITPWNFPTAIPNWKIAAALICGNTVVFKPASNTALCAVEVVKVYEAAGVPPGVLNFVTGSGSVVGNALVEDPRVRAISFTGGVETGREVYVRGAQQLKMVHLELGGQEPGHRHGRRRPPARPRGGPLRGVRDLAASGARPRAGSSSTRRSTTSSSRCSSTA